ncbi:von willebrand factor a domain-containing protein 5a [Anaeramoeba ignava]|uniref:von willebrand factor a domain-containing protein 5a n=1 Tax=Anaeramoeba ignava TaxID=1746090 RepID=A0A9Q0LDG3_ANAIG|nr:von willebrand factor a domain-containing protein 5a [Anaeramoeba ignava]
MSFGLFNTAEEIPIPLTGIQIKAKIIDFVGEVEITQRYQNINNYPLECVYKFLLDQSVAVNSFQAQIGDRYIQGVVKKNEKANEEYNDAIAQGETAMLLSEKKGKFEVSIGNFPSGTEIYIQIKYVVELEPNLNGDVVFKIPHQIAPLFHLRDPQFSSDHVHDSIQKVSNGISIDVLVFKEQNLAEIESNSLEIITSDFSNEYKLIQLKNECMKLEKDFELVIKRKNPSFPRIWIEKENEAQIEKDQEDAIMISLYPIIPQQNFKEISEIIFVVDQSGSMSGDRIEYTKLCLLKAMEKLPKSCFVNIVSFGSTYSALFEKSVLNNDANNKTIVDYIQKISANFGGTQLYSPLRFLLELEKIPRVPRQLFILTDGEIHDTQEVLNLVKRNSDFTRCFTIGQDASYDLVSGIAQSTGGKSVFVDSSNISQQVIQQISRALQPALTKIQLSWGVFENHVKQSPSKLTPFFNKERYIVYGFIKRNILDSILNKQTQSAQLEQKEPSYGLKIIADLPDGNPLTIELDFQNSISLENSRVIKTMAAKRLIHDLEVDNFDSIENVQTEIESLSLKYQITSQFTSFIAVDQNSEQSHETEEMRYQNFSYQSSVDTSCLLLLDVTPLTQSVDTQFGFSKSIISRNTTIPTRKAVTFQTCFDNQPFIKFGLFEGERNFSADNSLLKEFTIPRTKPESQSNIFDIALDLDANSILHVTFVDKANNQVFKQTIPNPPRLTQEQITKMVEDAYKFDPNSIPDPKKDSEPQIQPDFILNNIQDLIDDPKLILFDENNQDLKSKIQEEIKLIRNDISSNERIKRMKRKEVEAKFEKLFELLKPIISKLYSIVVSSKDQEEVNHILSYTFLFSIKPLFDETQKQTQTTTIYNYMGNQNTNYSFPSIDEVD